MGDVQVATDGKLAGLGRPLRREPFERRQKLHLGDKILPAVRHVTPTLR
jgi:hypothetical protein